jgi:hypothetical protein
VHPFLPCFWGCPRLLRWTNSGDHLRALLRFSMVSVLTPPHQSPFRIKASGAAPERRSSPCPWRPAPQQIIGTLPCPCGLQVKRPYAWHCLPRSKRPDGVSGRMSGIPPTSSQMTGLPGLGATLARAHGRGGGVTHVAPTQPMEVRRGVWLIRTSGWPPTRFISSPSQPCGAPFRGQRLWTGQRAPDHVRCNSRPALTCASRPSGPRACGSSPACVDRSV